MGKYFLFRYKSSRDLLKGHFKFCLQQISRKWRLSMRHLLDKRAPISFPFLLLLAAVLLLPLHSMQNCNRSFPDNIHFYSFWDRHVTFSVIFSGRNKEPTYLNSHCHWSSCYLNEFWLGRRKFLTAKEKKVNTRIAWLYSPTGELYLEQVNVCAKKLVG